MRFIVDESSGRLISELLKADGHDSVFAGDVARGASDEEILSLAETDGRILVTDDKDFGELVFRLRRPSKGVILLRGVEGSPQERMRVLRRVLRTRGLEGAFVTVRRDRIRVRRVGS